MFRRRMNVPQLAQRMPDIRRIAPFETRVNADQTLALLARLGAITTAQCLAQTGLTVEPVALTEAQAVALLNTLERHAKEAGHFGNIVLNNGRTVRAVLAELENTNHEVLRQRETLAA